MASKLDISNVVAAFSEDQVEQFTGLSKGRLRYWAKTGFFNPSFVEEDPRLPYSRFYSFKDIVGLRTLEKLRVQNSVPLQHLRQVAKELSELEDGLWTTTRLFPFRRRVYLLKERDFDKEIQCLVGEVVPRDVLSNQYAIHVIVLGEIIDKSREDIARARSRKPESIGKIQRRRSIARNAWAVAGTRIAVGSIKRLYEDGYSVEQILEEYPDLTLQDVRAALKHDQSKVA